MPIPLTDPETGTAVHPVRYTSGVLQDGGIWRTFKAEIKLDGTGSDTAEAVTNLFDFAGRQYKTIYSDGAFSQFLYRTNGQLAKTVDPDGVTTIYQYNGKGELEYTATDMDRNGTIDFSGTDRIRRTVTSVGQASSLSSVNARKTQTYLWAINNSSVSNLVSGLETSVDGLITWSSSFGLTNRTWTVYAGNGNRYVTNTAPDGSYAVSAFQNGLLQSVVRKDSLNNQLSSTSYGYDAHGRQSQVTDARNGTSVYAFDSSDRVSSFTTPPPGTGQGAQTTTYSHDYAGRVTGTTLPDGGIVSSAYSPKGELLTNYGARTYPVAYAYDAQGRRTNMTTWTSFANRSGAATTTWKFDGYRGFTTNKVYADGKGPSYTYTPGGRLYTRTWARGTSTTYNTNAAGDTVGITYSDGTSNAVYNLDRQGRATNVIDAAGSHFLTYSDSGLLLSESTASGLLAGLSVTNGYDAFLRRNQLAFQTNAVKVLAYSYGYDSASRLTNVSDGTYSAAYNYLANSPLISQITFWQNANLRMTTTKTFDLLNRLQSISSVGTSSTASPMSFSYTYNDANQRVSMALPDGSFWLYQYDSLGQVTSGQKYWSDWTPVAGQQFQYAFDDIGNRTSTKAGGDSSGGNLRSATYGANPLNQYTNRTEPNAADIVGIANPSATVTVNGQSTYRRGEYYQTPLSIDNSSSAVWQVVSNYASLGGTNQTNVGYVFLPKTPEVFGYDADGNQTNDGRWLLTWDGENRLIGMIGTNVVDAGKRKLEFVYDAMGRRVRKTVSIWSGGAWQVSTDAKFAYGDWNLLAELNATNSAPTRSFMWGLDLSGSMQGAGGVGGLLAVNVPGSGVHFPAFDGNGNVSGLASGADGSASAQYEYSPFGEVLRATGSAARTTAFRFSTKYQDDETDLIYYGYRYLNPVTGRWLSRDPLRERGGPNLFCGLLNNPVSYVDARGASIVIDNILEAILEAFVGYGSEGISELDLLTVGPYLRTLWWPTCPGGSAPLRYRSTQSFWLRELDISLLGLNFHYYQGKFVIIDEYYECCKCKSWFWQSEMDVTTDSKTAVMNGNGTASSGGVPVLYSYTIYDVIKTATIDNNECKVSVAPLSIKKVQDIKGW